MSLPTVPCTGKIRVDSHEMYFECIKVKKVFDEFALRECVEGIVFDLNKVPAGREIEPTLILKDCRLCNVDVKNASTPTEVRLRFSGKCCCDVYGKDKKGNIIRMKVIDLPNGNHNLSIGPDGELCFNFNVRREYPDATFANFKELLHFLDEERFEVQCFSEAIIDEDNNETECERLVTNMGIFIAIKFDAEVQLCVPVLGYCNIEEVIPIEESFCERFDMEYPVPPSFNPPQLDKPNGPYTDC